MKDEDKTKEQLIKELETSQTQRKRAEEALRERTHSLSERVKELNCLCGIATLAEKHDISLEEIFQGIVDLIPPAWQYPEVTCARIILEEQEFRTNNFKETIWKQASDIVVHGDRIGTLEVCYLEQKPGMDEGPFLKEERNLIKAIAEQLANTIERKRAEEALRESEKRYRDLADLLPQTVFELDERANVIFVNRNAFDMFRYSQQDFDKGLSAIQMFIPEDRDRAKENIKRRLRGEKFGANEYTALRKDGSTFPILVYSASIVREGKPIGLRGIIIDITERKQIEDELRRSRERLRNLSTHLERAREAERTAVAREIHDDLGQSLTALKMDLFFLRKRLPEEQESLIQKTTEMITLIDTSINEVKRISSQLRPGLLDDLGLVPAIQWQVGDFEQRTGIKCKLATNAEDIAIGRDISTAIFRILQEALTNVARHANATRVNINLRRKANSLELKIRDNGKGITKKQIQDSKSFGLMGMRERIEYLGGEFEITGIRGKGTTLVAIAPLNQNGKAQ